jgi:hypothetical protein
VAPTDEETKNGFRVVSLMAGTSASSSPQ